MLKQPQTKFLLVLVLLGILMNSCKKQEVYDLFPLNVGNEFYYIYYKHRSLPSAYTNGIETWKVLSELAQGDSIIHIIERKVNTTTVLPGLDTIINNSVSQFVISEKKSSSLISFWGLNFRRFQQVSWIQFKQQGGGSMSSWSYDFKADSGLVKYFYHHPPNSIYDESLVLDSVKIVP
jgi:hypothetical protein